MNITIHGKQSFLDQEKLDINIELPTFSDSLLTKLEFFIRNTSTNISTLFSFEIRYGRLDQIWLDPSDIDTMFDNFHLATDFKIYRQKGNTTYIEKMNNKWNDENKTMYLIY